MAIDDKLLGLHQQQTLVCRNIDSLRGFYNARDIRRRHLAVFYRHHARRVHAANMATRDAGVDAGDFAISHELGLFQGLLDTLHGGIDIDNDTAFQAIARSHTHTGKFEFTTWQDFSHDHHHLGRTNV